MEHLFQRLYVVDAPGDKISSRLRNWDTV